MRLAVSLWIALLSAGLVNAQPVCSFVGDAASLGGDCYQITDNQEWELGAVWFNNQLDLTQPFSIDVEVNLGGADATGADGIVMVMQSVGPSAIGAAGGGLGFEGFNPSFGVEIDTWQNVDVGDPPSDHVAFLRDGINLHTAPYFNLAGPVPALSTGGNIEDGADHRFQLNWDPSSELVELFMDCDLRLSLNVDLIGAIFSGNPNVWWGFTGSTGGSSNIQSVCITSSAVGLPPEHEVCAGEGVELVLEAAQQGTVVWSPEDGLSDPYSALTVASPAVTTSYTATWTDVCGESLQAQTVVDVLPLPAPSLPDTVSLCPEEVASLTAVVPMGFASAAWSDGTPLPDWTGDEPGWQSVTVVSGEGCTGADSTWISALIPQAFSMALPAELCGNADTLLAWPAGWNNWLVDASPSPSGWVATSGTASIEAVEVMTGCPLDTVLVIPELSPATASLSPGVQLCQGDGVQLDLTMAPGSSVTWTPTGGLSDPGVQQPFSQPDSTTLYSAEVVDVCGVTQSLSTLIEVFDIPEWSLPDTVSLCPGDGVTLDIAPLPMPGVPNWSDGSTGWSWTGLEAGWQSVVFEPLPGCSGADSTFIVNLAALVPSFSPLPALCPGDSLVVDLPEGWNQWAFNGESVDASSVALTAPGDYVVLAQTEGEGCPVATSLFVPSGALPALQLPELANWCPDQQLVLNAGVEGELFWSDGEVGTSRPVAGPGVYVATLIAECGSTSDTTEVLEVACGCSVYLPNAFSPDGDQLNDGWRPVFDCEPEEYSLVIFDRWGGKLWESNQVDEYWTGGNRGASRPADRPLYSVQDGIYSYVLSFRDPTYVIRKMVRQTGTIMMLR